MPHRLESQQATVDPAKPGQLVYNSYAVFFLEFLHDPRSDYFMEVSEISTPMFRNLVRTLGKTKT